MSSQIEPLCRCSHVCLHSGVFMCRKACLRSTCSLASNLGEPVWWSFAGSLVLFAFYRNLRVSLNIDSRYRVSHENIKTVRSYLPDSPKPKFDRCIDFIGFSGRYVQPDNAQCYAGVLRERSQARIIYFSTAESWRGETEFELSQLFQEFLACPDQFRCLINHREAPTDTLSSKPRRFGGNMAGK